MTIGEFAALVVVVAGCVTDLRSRRIPNVLTFGAAGAAFTYAFLTGGLHGLAWAAAGWGVGLALFVPFFALCGLGGGDVKLMAALGAWLGPILGGWTALWAMVAGGPLALVIALSRGMGRESLRNVWGLLTFWRVMGLQPHPSITLDAPSHGAPRLPYAVPMAVGLLVTLWLH